MFSLLVATAKMAPAKTTGLFQDTLPDSVLVRLCFPHVGGPSPLRVDREK
jgi:hypothetical protein